MTYRNPTARVNAHQVPKYDAFSAPLNPKYPNFLLQLVEETTSGSTYLARLNYDGEELEFTGALIHDEECKELDNWSIDDFARMSSQPFKVPVEKLIRFLGNTCYDQGLKVLEALIGPALDAHRTHWLARAVAGEEDDVHFLKESRASNDS